MKKGASFEAPGITHYILRRILDEAVTTVVSLIDHGEDAVVILIPEGEEAVLQ